MASKSIYQELRNKNIPSMHEMSNNSGSIALSDVIDPIYTPTTNRREMAFTKVCTVYKILVIYFLLYMLLHILYVIYFPPYIYHHFYLSNAILLCNIITIICLRRYLFMMCVCVFLCIKCNLMTLIYQNSFGKK